MFSFPRSFLRQVDHRQALPHSFGALSCSGLCRIELQLAFLDRTGKREVKRRPPFLSTRAPLHHISNTLDQPYQPVAGMSIIARHFRNPIHTTTPRIMPLVQIAFADRMSCCLHCPGRGFLPTMTFVVASEGRIVLKALAAEVAPTSLLYFSRL